MTFFYCFYLIWTLYLFNKFRFNLTCSFIQLVHILLCYFLYILLFSRLWLLKCSVLNLHFNILMKFSFLLNISVDYGKPVEMPVCINCVCPCVCRRQCLRVYVSFCVSVREKSSERAHKLMKQSHMLCFPICCQCPHKVL